VRFDLAEAQIGAGQHQEAVTNLLAVMKAAGPAWNEGAARITLLKLLDTLGSGNPIAVAGRKQLSKLLFR
jgi:putative thioredoxin